MAFSTCHIVILEYCNFLIKMHLLVTSWPLGVTAVEITMLLCILLFVTLTTRIRLLTSSLVYLILVWWKETLRCLVLPCQTHTRAWLMQFTISSHHAESGSIISSMRTIHRWPLNLHGLRFSLLVRINSLSRLISSNYTNWALWLLIAASKIATSIGKGLVIGHDVVDSFIDVRLIYTL